MISCDSHAPSVGSAVGPIEGALDGAPVGELDGVLLGALLGASDGASDGALDGAGVDPQQAHSLLLLFTTREQSGLLVDACGTEHCPSVGLMFGEADEDL